ncbi:uncharacterized protein RAG0_12519 [Rhynchosporium agropyri]|uniref:Uncharacterized protein n=1 Tax=Rhynchosporium agropyri TaxID=914238 RepID=A0A1E1L8N4_9HELO|nr:uncharacterized protein RAG0_12519 [Rhynchosporium agropyri]
MLLTIKQPAQHGYKSFHDYTPPTPPATSRFSPAVASSGPAFPQIPATNKSLPSLPVTKSFSRSMSTPHRGLPPPGVMSQPGLMTLPPPTQQQQIQQQQQHPPPLAQQPPLSQPMGQLPAPPPQWQGAEESMSHWLHAKAEEDKRKQEEEKTRQESLRLEQRKIEQDMLRTSLSGGIPPHMIPMVFAGMGGGNLPNASLEWAQHFMAQAHQPHPQQILPPQAQVSPEQLQRRDSRVVSQPYGAQQHPVPLTLPSTPIGPSSSQQSAGFLPSYQLSPASRARQSNQGQGTITRPPPTSHLPRLNTGEMHIQPPPAGSSIQHPLQQSQSAQQEQHSSPSIYFHHWQPPTTQADHTSSPKKRKATGPQQAAPPPTSQPQYTSPPFSGSSVSNTPSSRRRAHSRQRSDYSSRGLDSYGRPHSRQRQSEGFGQNLTSPPPQHSHVHGFEQQAQGPTSSNELRRRSGGSHPVSSMLEQPPQSQSQHISQHQRDPYYSAGPEMKHDGRRSTPEERGTSISRGTSLIKRDEGRN